MARSVFITGGAGFIGSRLAHALSPNVDQITVFDNLHPQVHGEGATPPALPGNTTFVRGDVTDAQALRDAVVAANPDIIVHLASETGTGQSYDEPVRYAAVNVMGTAHLIEAMRRLPKGVKRRVVNAGSRAVYGEGAYLTAHRDMIAGPVRDADAMARGVFDPVGPDGQALEAIATPETLPPEPASIYASTKLMQEYLFQNASAGGDFDVCLLRFQNVYGPGQSLKNPYTGVLSIFAAQILDGRRLNIFEDGEIVRDFVFVDDVVRACVVAAFIDEAPAGPVNIGSGYAATICECAQTLLERLGAARDNYDISGDFRAGDIRYALADISRAKDALGWRPEASLEDGLNALADWARAERQKSNAGTGQGS